MPMGEAGRANIRAVGPSSSPSQSPPGRGSSPADRLRRWLDAPSRFDGTFPPRIRRLGVIWLALTLPTVPLWGFLVDGPESYVVVFVVIASGTYTTPSLVAGWYAIRRGPDADRLGNRLWFGGVIGTYVTGLSMLVGVGTGWRLPEASGTALVALIGVSVMAGALCFVRNRSGRRAVAIDAIEAAMSLLVVAAPAVVLWADDVVSADARWFTVPAALAALAMVAGCYWALVVFVRLGPDRGALAGCGIVLAFVGAANAVAQTAQGISGFTLPAVPLIAVQALCMSMLLLVPLYLPGRVQPGLDRLPPQAQVRGGAVSALLILAGLPVLLGVTVVRADAHRWVVPFSVTVLALLLVLAILRQLGTAHETRRLYAQVERASEARRRLLAEMMQRVDEDRHRVAAQLHEQAVSSYASFVSFIQAMGGAGGAPTPMNGASTAVRDDLSRHAESLRQLMLAIRPIETDRGGAQTLDAPIRAYVDSLYGDCRSPEVSVAVADGLVLGWVTETIALRIVQEAVRNVWSHSGASHVHASIGVDGDVVEVRVSDDGVGFDPDSNLFESGIAAMRSFAAVCDGTVSVESSPGAGTAVVARLGGSVATSEPEPQPRLRLVRGWGGR